VVSAADAMGGADTLQSLSTLQIFGYGQEAYQDGGSLITTEATAPEKMTSMTAYNRVIDLANNRTRVQARFYRAFVFAAEAMMKGAPVDQSLDGAVAYDLAGNGTARRGSEATAMTRRYDMLAIAPVAVRAALDSSSAVSNRRRQDKLTLVDVTTEDGMNFTLAVNNDSGLPAWMRWLEPHENQGEIAQRAEYSAWLPVDGILLPMSINTVSDWKDTVMLRLNIDRYIVNGSIDNLAAPAAVRTAPAPVQTYTVNAEPVADQSCLVPGGHRQGSRHRAGQGDHTGHHFPSPLRPHRWPARSHRRRHHPGGPSREHGMVRGTGKAESYHLSRQPQPQSASCQHTVGGRSPAIVG
jgi:hypothetical protein